MLCKLHTDNYKRELGTSTNQPQMGVDVVRTASIDIFPKSEPRLACTCGFLGLGALGKGSHLSRASHSHCPWKGPHLQWALLGSGLGPSHSQASWTSALYSPLGNIYSPSFPPYLFCIFLNS